MEMRCKATGERFLIASNDPKATENGLVARFTGGSHPNKHLQSLWNEHGAEGFAFEMVETLEDNDPQKEVTDELQELLELCLAESPKAMRVWR